ncbi:MAG: VCBS repeat-containing protein, partial [Ignavibacteriae bacterium]|nr:VCBS repeat-containing protein [Ignavibacteriota bacterium]
MKLINFILTGLLFVNLSLAQIPFNTAPTWISTNFPKTSTGCGWADINNDGWMDLVVANGNDMNRQKVTVYFNNAGTLATTPGWQSTDIDYHGHLSVGDINNDGWTDLAVSVYLGAAGFGSKGKVKIYMNNSGTLEANPSWVSADSMFTFSCAFGDANNDGYLDLAVACGESYDQFSDNMRIYKNVNGVMQTLPYWKSTNLTYGMDVDWADINKDGKLDLVYVCERGQSLIYLNYGDSIGRSPYWISVDANIYSNSLFLADVNNDSNIDLAVADNNQIGGAGKFKIYLNTGTTLNTTPYWSSTFSGYGSGIILADIDFDGWKDLICGGWWKPCWIYKNNNGTFQLTPQWTSSTSSVVEAIKCTDYNNDGLDTLTVKFTGNGVKKLYYLNRSPLQKIIWAKFGTNIIPQSDYCFNLENGWISFKNTPPNSTAISIKYLASHSLDFAVSNWDNTGIGNYVFKNNFVVGVKKITSEIPGE